MDANGDENNTDIGTWIILLHLNSEFKANSFY